ncbi:MAG: hypothetical protein V2A54_04645 [Bacteroidota bacterium]
MKRLLVIPLLFLFSFAYSQTETYEEFADSLSDWVIARVENAAKGKPEMVEMPFVARCWGWGCMCPDYYIGVSVGVLDGKWVFPKAPKGFPKSDSLGYSMIVTGYFTGKWKDIDLRNEEKEPAEWLYHMPVFKVLTWRENTVSYEVPPPKVTGKAKK